MFWWILIIVVGFLLVRSIMRAVSAPPPGAPTAPGYGYGGFGGGGSFWSGLLGGLGGAWLGNELFRGTGGGIAPTQADPGGGWQSDAGQADSSGDFGGGGDAGGGGGDSGGG